MVRDRLTKEITDEGKKLVKCLLGSDLEITAAFWLYNEDSEKWKLVVTSPAVDREGPRYAYEKIQPILQNNDFNKIKLYDISAMESDYEIARLLRKSLGQIKEVSEVEMPPHGAEAKYIEETYVYYLE